MILIKEKSEIRKQSQKYAQDLECLNMSEISKIKEQAKDESKKIGEKVYIIYFFANYG